jgi:high-affinity iron transporter
VFETILFYIAMWSDQASTAILAGLVAGIAVLAAVAYWMLRMSRRLPIGRFFSISSILIAVMAVILIGKGVAALQEAGWISQTPLALPRIEWIGLYPPGSRCWRRYW